VGAFENDDWDKLSDSSGSDAGGWLEYCENDTEYDSESGGGGGDRASEEGRDDFDDSDEEEREKEGANGAGEADRSDSERPCMSADEDDSAENGESL
jgi:hypothetical protein